MVEVAQGEVWWAELPEPPGSGPGLRRPVVEIEVVCSDKRQHRLRVESRVTDIDGLVLPTWQRVLDRYYEPWTTAQVVDTAGCTPEESLSQVETIVRRHQA